MVEETSVKTEALHMCGSIQNMQACAVMPVASVATGSLAIPLALRGASVSASDISAAMAGEAQERYNAAVASGQAAPAVAPKFEALDLE